MNEMVKKIMNGIDFKELGIMTYGKLCKALDIVELDIDIKQAVFIEYVKAVCDLSEEYDINYEAARQRIYFLRHPEWNIPKCRRYAKEHPDVIKANRAKNKDKIRERNKWRYHNDDEFRKRSIEFNKRWREKNKEKYNEYHRNYCQKRKEEMMNNETKD